MRTRLRDFFCRIAFYVYRRIEILTLGKASRLELGGQ